MPTVWLLLSFVYYSLMLEICGTPDLETAEKKREEPGSGM